MTIQHRDSGRKSVPFRTLLLTTALGLAFTGGTAQAGWPAIDVGNMTTHLTNFGNSVESYIKQGKGYADQLARWQQTVSYFQNQLVKLKSQLTGLGLPQGVELQEVPEDYLVKESCTGDQGGFSMSKIGQMMGFNSEGDIVAQQRQICVNIQVMQNRQFNETVQYLRTTMGQMKSLQKSMNDHSNTSEDPGNVVGFMNDAQRLQGKMESTQDEYDQRMAAYTAYIETQEEVQRTYATQAIKGKDSSLIGQLGKTAILKGALSID